MTTSTRRHTVQSPTEYPYPAFLVERCTRGGYDTPQWKVVRASDGLVVDYHRAFEWAQESAAAWNRTEEAHR